MLNDPQNIIFREMALDLGYRLQLFDEMFCQTGSLVLSAAATEDCDTKVDATTSLRTCAQCLRLIFADYSLLFDAPQLAFPAEFHVWLWFMADADQLAHDYLQSLKQIALTMENRLASALEHREVAE